MLIEELGKNLDLEKCCKELNPTIKELKKLVLDSDSKGADVIVIPYTFPPISPNNFLIGICKEALKSRSNWELMEGGKRGLDNHSKRLFFFETCKSKKDIQKTRKKIFEYTLDNLGSHKVILFCKKSLIPALEKGYTSKLLRVERLQFLGNKSVLRRFIQRDTDISGKTLDKKITEIEEYVKKDISNLIWVVALLKKISNKNLEKFDPNELDMLKSNVSQEKNRELVYICPRKITSKKIDNSPLLQYYLTKVLNIHLEDLKMIDEIQDKGIKKPKIQFLESRFIKVLEKNNISIDELGKKNLEFYEKIKIFHNKKINKKILSTFQRYPLMYSYLQEDWDEYVSIMDLFNLDKQELDEANQIFNSTTGEKIKIDNPKFMAKELFGYIFIIHSQHHDNYLNCLQTIILERLPYLLKKRKNQAEKEYKIRDKMISNLIYFFNTLYFISSLRYDKKEKILDFVQSERSFDAVKKIILTEKTNRWFKEIENLSRKYESFENIIEELEKTIENKKIRNEIDNLDLSKEGLEKFVSLWINYGFTLENYEKLSLKTQKKFSIKYHNFSDYLVEEYKNILNNESEYRLNASILKEINNQEDYDHNIVLVIDACSFFDIKTGLENETIRNNISNLEETFKDFEIDYRVSPIPTLTPVGMSSLLTGIPPHNLGIYSKYILHAEEKLKLILNKKETNEIEMNDFLEKIEILETNKIDLDLIQKGNLNDSPLTEVLKKFNPGIKGIPVKSTKKSLKSLRKEFIKTLRNRLERRNKYLSGKLKEEVPEEYKDKYEDNVNEPNSNYILYIPLFDKALHEGEYSPQQFYEPEMRFIKNMIEDIKNLLDDFEEISTSKIRIIITADHGKLLNSEEELLTNHLPLGKFKSKSSIKKSIKDIFLEEEIIGCSASKSYFGWTESHTLPSELKDQFKSEEGLKLISNKIWNNHSKFSDLRTPTFGVIYKYKARTNTKIGSHGGLSLGELLVPYLEMEVK